MQEKSDFLAVFFKNAVALLFRVNKILGGIGSRIELLDRIRDICPNVIGANRQRNTNARIIREN